MSGMFSRWKINENPRVCGEIKSHTPLPTASVRSVITVEISGKSIYIKKKNVVTDRGRRFEKSKANKEEQNERTNGRVADAEMYDACVTRRSDRRSRVRVSTAPLVVWTLFSVRL